MPAPPPKTLEQKVEEYVAQIKSVDTLDKLAALIDKQRGVLHAKQKDVAERKAAAAVGDHVALAEQDRKRWPTYKEGDTGLWWSSTTSLKKMPSGVSPGPPSMRPPQREQRLGGWVGGPKWMFSRERRRLGATKYDKNPNEPLMEEKARWFPMYVEMQRDVEAAWQQWQQEVLERGTWEGVGEAQPTLPTLSRKLIGCTEPRHPGKDDRWQYEIDFDKMEQANIATKTVRRIRRFGMEFDGHAGHERFDPEQVGVLKAASGGVQT